jgi:hypothetical protein
VYTKFQSETLIEVDWAQWDDNIKMGFKEVIYVFSRLRADSDGGLHAH